jgi:hypothetical protein
MRQRLPRNFADVVQLVIASIVNAIAHRHFGNNVVARDECVRKTILLFIRIFSRFYNAPPLD